MPLDIDAAIAGWEVKAGIVQSRVIDASDGRQVLQMRVDLGILQMELGGRPDGLKPHGFATYLDHLKHQSAQNRKAKQRFTLNEEQCMEADREFLQFYHRRICWLALRNYDRAIIDADHTLHFMDFVKAHGPSEDYILAHEQYRGFVIFHRTQAYAGLHLEKNEPERAIDALQDGLREIFAFYKEHNLEERTEEDPMIQQLQKMQQQIRELHGIESTLREQLDRAVADEQYERAAQLRDELRKRGEEV
jgi:hypothetical protein